MKLVLIVVVDPHAAFVKLHYTHVAMNVKPVRLKTVKGDGVRSGVTLDRSTSLLDRMGS